MGQARQRFAGLDLMRGLAALAVLSLHMPRAAHTEPLLPRAYLAVDFFFALSGFVLAHAYGARLGRELGPADFLRIRLKRLYPLYLVALVAGAILMLSDVAAAADPVRSLRDWAGALGTNLLFLPAPSQVAGAQGLLFPAVGAAWSLFWELAANLLYALLAKFARKAIWLVSPIALLLLATLPGHPTLDGGAYWSSFTVGGLRVCWAFFFGVMLQRFIKVGPEHSSRCFGWFPAAAMVMLFAVDPPRRWVGIYDLLFVVGAVPLLIIIGARATLDRQTAQLATWLGGISYAVYILQSPILKFLEIVTGATHRPLAGLGLVSASMIFVGSTLLIAQLVQSRPGLQPRRATTTSPAAR